MVSKTGNDTEAWDRLLMGDMQALQTIYEKYAHSIYQYGIRMMHDENAVHDCIQDLFIGLWSKREKLPQVLNVRSYIISAFRNSMINYQLSAKKYSGIAVSDQDYFDLKFNVEADVIEREKSDEQARILSQAMLQLTVRQREIVYLRYYEELEYTEIAAIMDLTLKGTYKLNARALEALRSIMNIDKVLLLAILLSLKK